jgi:hypothetical protein
MSERATSPQGFPHSRFLTMVIFLFLLHISLWPRRISAGNPAPPSGVVRARRQVSSMLTVRLVSVRNARSFHVPS